MLLLYVTVQHLLVGSMYDFYLQVLNCLSVWPLRDIRVRLPGQHTFLFALLKSIICFQVLTLTRSAHSPEMSRSEAASSLEP